MNKLLLTALLSTTLVPLCVSAKMVGVEAQKSLDITIYNENRALINDSREVPLSAGKNAIAYSDVSRQIMPESALLQGKNIRLVEQNFNFDLLSENSLLQKAVGSSVLVEYINPATGAKTTESAELLAVNGNNPVLKINGKIETQYPGRVIFNKVPENLWPKPTLVMDIESAKEETQKLELSYLTRGLSWRADYVAQLNADETKMNLNGLVTLTNNSGTDYKKAALQLVAGDVNVVTEYVRPMFRKNVMMATGAMDMAAESASVAPLSDFYLYTLPNKTDILSNQTKQVSLLAADAVKVKKVYEFDNTLDMMYTTEWKKVKPSIFLTFENKKDSGLGIALPKGIIRLYKADAADKMLFVGEDNIQHTGNLETVRLNMGTAFDISADAKRIDYKQLAAKLYEATYQITFKNGGDKMTTVAVFQDFPNGWKILSETLPHVKENSNRLKWDIQVPAKGEFIFTYKAQIKND